MNVGIGALVTAIIALIGWIIRKFKKCKNLKSD
jgi:hypothetical protein